MPKKDKDNSLKYGFKKFLFIFCFSDNTGAISVMQEHTIT